MKQSIDPEVFAHAVRWHARLAREDVTDTDEENFALWMAEDDSHMDAYEVALSLSDDMASLEETYAPEMDKAVAHTESDNKSNSVVSLPRRFVRSLSALAAVLLVSFLTVTQLVPYLETDRYSAEQGEVLEVALSDGSVMHMNTGTEATFKSTDTERKVALISGEAYFDVRKDPERPFKVLAGGISVEAVGTEFNVWNDSEEIRVSVTEGVVKVEGSASLVLPPNMVPVRLEAGEAIIYSHATGTIEQKLNTNGIVASWRNGFLMYSSASLQEVLDDLARYTGEDYVLAEDGSEATKVSGIIQIEKGVGIKTALRENYGIQFSGLEKDRVLVSGGK